VVSLDLFGNRATPERLGDARGEAVGHGLDGDHGVDTHGAG